MAGPRAVEMRRVKAGFVNGFLKIHSEVNIVEKKLKGPLVLVIATQGAKDHQRLAVFHHQAGSDCGPGPLARLQTTRVPWVKPEHLTAHSKREAKAWDDG